MKQKFIDLFAAATCEVIATMAKTEVSIIECYDQDVNTTWGDITGLVGMDGDQYDGFMMISFKTDVICEVVKCMIAENHSEIDAEIVDAVGELTNMISSGTRNRFSTLGVDLDMALPMTIKGKGVEVNKSGNGDCFQITFQTRNGQFVVQGYLNERT